MSKRDARLFLLDMLEQIEKIERCTDGLSFDQFEADEMVPDAIVRNLEVIGVRLHTTYYLPYENDTLKSNGHTQLAFGTQSFTHFAVDVEIVWTIATQRFSELKAILKKMLQDHSLQ